MTKNSLIKRIEALEKQIATRPPELLQVGTISIAKRIEKALKAQAPCRTAF
jgi:hypothetical protein